MHVSRLQILEAKFYLENPVYTSTVAYCEILIGMYSNAVIFCCCRLPALVHHSKLVEQSWRLHDVHPYPCGLRHGRLL